MTDYSNSDHPSPLYDLSQLENVAQGNPQFVDKMVRIFLEQVPLSVQEINNAYSIQDFDKIMKVAHKIKPMIDMMGIVSLKQEVRLLEKNAKNLYDLKELESHLTNFTNVLGKVSDSLNKDTITLPDTL